MKMTSTYRVIYCAVLAFLACAGCTSQPKGASTAHAQAIPISSLQKLKPSTPVVAHGTMVEKCPLAGCWFVLRDQSGTIKVDLKATKQTVVNIPLNSEVTVEGTVAADGSNKIIRAVRATF
jgi:uncharacterized protein YdeI (BOF family)